MYYPINLDLTKKVCLVYGFGRVGQRKVQGLIPCKPKEILVYDLLPREALSLSAKKLLNEENVSYHREAVTNEILRNCHLVFAATNDAAANSALAKTCQELGVLCNSVSNPMDGDFVLGAVLRKGPCMLTLSTGGASPALAKRLKEELNEWLSPHVKLILFLQFLRPKIVKVAGGSDEHKEIIAKILDGPIPKLLNSELTQNAKRVIAEWLQENTPLELSQTDLANLLLHLAKA